MLKKSLTSLPRTVLLITLVLALFATIFIGYKSAKFDMIYSDAIVDNNFLQLPFSRNDISIQAIHTHLIKWPIALFENMVGFNQTTHILTSIFLLIIMNGLLFYVFYRFSGRNLLVTSACIALLTSIELAQGLNAGEGTLSMITQRNIELPIMIGLVTYLLYRSRRTFKLSIALISSLLLLIVFISDYLLLYTTVIGAVVYVVYRVYKVKNLSELRDNAVFYVPILFAALFTFLTVKALDALNIVDFFTMKNPENPLRFVSSSTDLFDITSGYVGSIFAVFGANFFNAKIEDIGIYFINLLVVAVGIPLLFKFLWSEWKKPSESTYNKSIVAMSCMYLLAMLIFTIIIPRELAGRYFAFFPLLVLLVFSRKYGNFHFKSTRNEKILIVSILFVSTAFILFQIVNTNQLLYQPRYDKQSKRIGDSGKIINELKRNNINALINIHGDNQAFWHSHVIKQQYDQSTKSQLAISSVFCGGMVVDKNFSKKSWSIPNGNKVAIRIKNCNPPEIKNLFGEPNSIVILGEDDVLYIYKSDIRTKLNLIQYETNTFIVK